MKVNYKKTILQRIMDEKRKAAKDAYKIESVELTYEEWSELLDYIERYPGFVTVNNTKSTSKWDITELLYNDIKIIQETRMV